MSTLRSQKHFQKLLGAFDKAAQNHGWERDQGSAESAGEAIEHYNRTKYALLTYVNKKFFPNVRKP